MNIDPGMPGNTSTLEIADDHAGTVVIDPVPYVHALWRRKLSIVALPILFAAAFLALSYTRPKIFQASVQFLPPQRVGAGTIFTFKPSNGGDEYRTELASRTVGIDVVQHQDLVNYFHAKDEDNAYAVLRGSSKFVVDSNNFLTVTVSSTDPQFPARVANEYFHALYRLTERIAAQESEHRLNFMSGPLEIERQRLRESEEALRTAQQKTGLVLPAAQASLGVQQVASLRTRVSDLNAQLASALTSSTEQNPRVVTLRSEIGSLQGQINRLESGSTQANSPSQLPELSLEVTRREREVQFHTTALEALTRSLETVQMSESYTPSLSLIDPAIIPRFKSSPARILWILFGLVFGFTVAVVRVLLSVALRQWKSSRSGSATIRRWRQTWHHAG